jgi:hypothetical protein
MHRQEKRNLGLGSCWLTKTTVIEYKKDKNLAA